MVLKNSLSWSDGVREAWPFSATAGELGRREEVAEDVAKPLGGLPSSGGCELRCLHDRPAEPD